MDEQNNVIPDGAIAFEDDRLTYVGAIPEELNQYDRVISAGGKVILPGLINTHGHAAMSLLRGFADDLPLKEWLETKMWPMEARFSNEHVKWGTYLAIVEMLKTGTTCFVDMYDHMDEVGQAVEISGIRGVLCRGAIGLGSQEEQKQKLEEAATFARNWHGAADGRITTMMAPHSPYTCPPAYIARFVDRAEALDLPIHIHMSETKREVEQNVRDYGQRPVAHLEQIGVFNRPTLVAHAVHVNDEEMDVLKNYDVKISHNPGSNLKLGSGIAPVSRMLQKGLDVSLGTDSAASNNNLDMFEEMRLAALIHKGAEQDPLAIPAQTALNMGTRIGAKTVFLSDSIGSLEPGKKADFIILDFEQSHLQPAFDVISHVVYAASGKDVRDVYIDGKQVVSHGVCLTVDEERVMYEANRVIREIM
ncbi:MAG: amidohydrolase [Bacillaceae bacterium]|nr:amidohydrolase [Bacillaceae bacterium]